MGLLVPKTKEHKERAIKNELNAILNTPEMAEAMGTLIDAYNEEDPAAFKKNANEYFDLLYSFMSYFEINKGIQVQGLYPDAENYFPPAERTQKNFKETFHKLWKSISIAAAFKKTGDVYIMPDANVEKIYHNYIPVYDQILKERDMIEGLGHYYDLPLYEKRQNSIIKLNYILNKHKTNEPFNQSELLDIKEAARELNRGFKKLDERGDVTNPGLFAGDSIQNPKDLQEYIDRYETMLRDCVKNGTKDFYIFAQGYVQDGDTLEVLKEEDVEVINHVLDDVAIEDEQLKSLMQELSDLQDKSKGNEYLNSVIKDYNKKVAEGYSDLKADVDVTNAREAYKRELEFLKNDLEAIKQYSKGKNNPKGVKYRYDDGLELPQIYQDGEKKMGLIQIGFSFPERKYKDNRVPFEKKKDDASKQFHRSLSEQVLEEIPNYYKTVKPKLEELKKERETLIQDPYQSQYQEKKKKLQKEIGKLKSELESHIKTFKDDRNEMYNTLQHEIQPFQENMKKSYKLEKEARLAYLKEATTFLKVTRQNMKAAYEETYHARRVAEVNEANMYRKLCSQLMDICEAMNSVTKISLFGNSSKYNDMVTAIKSYCKGDSRVEDAYKACQDYLKLSLNEDGSLKNMDSDAGKIRKQACVLMLELLEKAPGFEKAKDKDNSKDVQRYKLDYAELKGSLAAKSADVTVENDSSDAKAYSNLNAKLSEIREKRKIAKKAKKTKKMPKDKKIKSVNIKNNLTMESRKGF